METICHRCGCWSPLSRLRQLSGCRRFVCLYCVNASGSKRRSGRTAWIENILNRRDWFDDRRCGVSYDDIDFCAVADRDIWAPIPTWSSHSQMHDDLIVSETIQQRLAIEQRHDPAARLASDPKPLPTLDPP